jgi:beta-galactosidase
MPISINFIMMKNQLTFVLLFCIFAFQQVTAQLSFGKAEIFNNDWVFQLQNIDDAKNKDFNDAKWRKLSLPHDWSVEGVLSPALSSCTGYLPGGIGWYRKHFTVSSQDNDKKYYIYFEGVYNHSEVFVNGQSMGKRPNGNISFMYDITPFLQYDCDNVIAVKVDHSLAADSRWYHGSGINRNVYLVQANPLHIDQWGLFYQTIKADAKEALINVQVHINNNSSVGVILKVELSLISVEGKEVGHASFSVDAKASSVTPSSANLKVKSPELWSIQDPYLYQLRTQIFQADKLLDENTQPAGIRTITFDPDKGFALNGQWMKMKGVCIHDDAGVLGSAVPREVWQRRLKTLKELGCNEIRMSHNPHAPELYDLCDELGFLVMDEGFDEWEFPKKKWIEGWNKGTPGFEGSATFFNEWSDRDMSDLVLRDRNHPCIVMWSIGNEVDYPNDPYSHRILATGTINQPVYGGYLPDNPPAERLGAIAKRLATDVRKSDNSRPVTAALAGVIMSNETEYPAALDIVGYNYTEDRYKEDHQKYPKRVIYGSENGKGLYAWKAVRDNDFIFGQFLWTGIDYLGESLPWPSRGFESGLLDLAGFKKPNAYFQASLWSDKPVIYIGTYPVPDDPNNLSTDTWPLWNYNAGEKIRVVCYTNCQQSQLFLNGKQVGNTLPFNAEKGILYWDIPFEEGKLEVIGISNGKEACRYAINTSGRPDGISAKPDIEVVKTNGVVQIELQIIDEKGNPVLLADNEIKCTIDGLAKLLGLEASNNEDMGNYKDNRQRVYQGRLIAYLKGTNEPGKVKLTFSSPWLKSAEVSVDVVK